jgi:cysteine synthase
MIPWKTAVPLSVLDAVGATTLVRLSRVVPPGCATVLAKLEWGTRPAA